VENVKKLEEINHELMIRFTVREGISAGQEQLESNAKKIDALEKTLMVGIANFGVKDPKKEIK
jgi:hypothetical protein